MIEGARQTIREPLFSVEVVHHERSTRREMSASRLERLLREEVALEADRRLPGHERERVGKREDDEVVGSVRALQEGTTIRDDAGHPRVIVWVFGMVLDADRLDLRIDLDGVDVLRSLPKRDRHIVAVPGADNEHAVGRGADPFIRDLVIRTDGCLRRLVRDAVRGDRRRGAGVLHQEPVVRRPDRLTSQCADRKYHQQRDPGYVL